MLSWSDRHEILDEMNSLKLNTYLYGPKEDPFHRYHWQIPYPTKWLSEFKELVAHGKKKGITVSPSLSPGLSFDYTNDQDYLKCLTKFNAFAKCGARHLTLFMDDIPEELPKNCESSFKSLGEAHGRLLARLQKDLREKFPKVHLWFCPTVYCDQFAKTEIKTNLYLHDLAATMPKNIALLWTGPKIISPFITKKNISAVSKLFNGNIIIWDNFYANDYCPNRLFVGSFTGRDKTLLSAINGLCINPTGLPNTDKILLRNLSNFIYRKNHSSSIKTPETNKNRIPAKFKTISSFFSSPFMQIQDSALSNKKIASYKEVLRYLIWDWKSPLHREWYPYLFMLDSDLTLLGKIGSKEISETWLRKKYSPVISKVLLNQISLAIRARRT